MKSGVRALGIAESYHVGHNQSTLAGAVVRADRVCDGLVYGTCTVGGTDATDAVIDLIDELGRPDVRYILLGAVAPSWFNIVDISRVHESVSRPILAVTFEDSAGLSTGLRDAFSGIELDERLALYRSLPDRRELSVNDEIVYVRAVGLESTVADEVVRTFTPEGGRPEPIRVARLAARAAASFSDPTN